MELGVRGPLLGVGVGVGMIKVGVTLGVSRLCIGVSVGTALGTSVAAAGGGEWYCRECGKRALSQSFDGDGGGGIGGGGGKGGVSSSISARSVPHVGAPSCGAFAGMVTPATLVAPWNMATLHPMLRMAARGEKAESPRLATNQNARDFFLRYTPLAQSTRCLTNPRG